MRRLAPAILAALLAGCGAVGDFDPHGITYTGEKAKSHLLLCDGDQLPASISDLWVYDGGTFNGMIYYVSFKCETLEDCWMAVHAFGAPEKTEFTNGVVTKYAVIRHGPSFYSKGFQHPQWDIPDIENGVCHERNQGDRNMDFWAIDLDRLRMYFHHESGGFPDDPPSVRHQ